MSWQFWIDRGGTFTDIVARGPDGDITTAKLLSENPEQYEDAAIEGISRIIGGSLETADIGEVKMGTTVATNALLERKGERVVFVTNKGFGDILRIGYQARPYIFALQIELPEMLYERVIEAPGRIMVDGSEDEALDTETAKKQLQSAYDAGIRAVAVAFMHAYRYPDHEKRIAQIAREIGFTQISISSQTIPLMKLVGRGDTTVVDAYLSPILRRYVNRVEQELGTGPRLMFMQSSGGLTDAHHFQGKDAILSGPAGGIVGAVQTAKAAGFNNIIGFDMGGTSTDIAHYGGDYERSDETTVAGVRLRAPMMNIHTVAAGGGSVCFFDGTRYRVGPDSAGANPGPACYRRGGPLTVTDCNVMLGKIIPDQFPHVFGPNANEPLDADIVTQKFTDLANQTPDNRTPIEVAEGFLSIAIENMARAIKKISVQRGHDVTRCALVCFGGAGGQHACLVADRLNMDTVYIHPHAGVLSAYGMGLAKLLDIKETTIEMDFTPDNLIQTKQRLDTLATDAQQSLIDQGAPPESITLTRRLNLKYKGADTTLAIDWGTPEQIQLRFDEAHRACYGFISPGKPIAIESITAIAEGGEAHQEPAIDDTDVEIFSAQSRGTALAHMAGKLRETGLYHRDDLTPGASVAGPAIIAEHNATTIIEPGWQAVMKQGGHLILTRIAQRDARIAIGTNCDPVMLEIFNNLFMSVAEQMGSVLEHTAYSVNIKERLDFSCAIFTKQGGLIANAPHMPVHLGSMGESVRAIINSRGDTMKPGDVYMLNNPYQGGTHLPDITVITPVFDREGKNLLFFTASRGHHADIGGITPGSMPPDSKHIDEEGVLITDFKLVDQGTFLENDLLALLSSGPYPARNPVQNIGDLQAQIAANEHGIHGLHHLIETYGLDVVTSYMQHVQNNAAEQVRRVLDVLHDGSFELELDNGAVIKIAVVIDKKTRSAVVDFTGTSAQHDSNFNAPASVTRAAVLYVFRTLVADDIPLNEGCMEPIELIIPEGCLLNPHHPAAVVAGNVETSQCVTDALYGALGVMAAAQGTMNNVTFGNETYQYYETICGGSGAGDGFDGCDAVHTHMTNSRLTDPEVLEFRFPVMVEDFHIRHGSGGKGKFTGGDGTVRKLKFLQPMTAAILSNHRRIPPFGLNGAEAGTLGRNYVIRADGSHQDLTSTDKANMKPGDMLVIETPGGGGFGKI